jgi:hypothetical protein
MPIEFSEDIVIGRSRVCEVLVPGTPSLVIGGRRSFVVTVDPPSLRHGGHISRAIVHTAAGPVRLADGAQPLHPGDEFELLAANDELLVRFAFEDLD